MDYKCNLGRGFRITPHRTGEEQVKEEEVKEEEKDKVEEEVVK